MKKLTILLILFISLVFIVPIQVSATTNAGVKQGSFLYFFDTTFEKVGLFFTFGSEKKAQKALEYADERLAEAEESANENKPKAIEKAMEDYEKKILFATEKSKEIDDQEKAEELLNTVSENTAKHQEVLEGVLEKVPEEAREAIAKAIEVSKKGQEKAMERIAELQKEVGELKEEIKDLKNELEEKDRAEELSVRSTPTATPKPVEVQKQAPKISTTPLSNSQIIKKVKPAVVYIETDAGTGSGMIISSDGFILTNAHVVQDSATAQITLSSGSIYLASVVGRDENVDLAVLKINVQNLSAVEFGDSSATEQGDEVFTLGYPFGIKGDVSFKEGTISRKIADGVNTYIETSAEIHPGNSGGPLVNIKGNVIGVNSASFGQNIKGITIGETIKFAIPINIAKNLIPELKAGRQVVVPKTETPPVGDPFQTEDSSLKIAQCQAERDSSISSFVSLTNSAVESAIATLKAEVRTYADEQLRLYDSCWFGPDKSQNPESLCRNYTARAQAKIDQTGNLITEMKREGEASILKAKALADISYNKCINK